MILNASLYLLLSCKACVWLIKFCVGNKAKYVGQYKITDEDARKAAMDAGGRIRLTIEAKLSPGPLRRHGVIGRWHGLVDSIASGNFLGALSNY